MLSPGSTSDIWNAVPTLRWRLRLARFAGSDRLAGGLLIALRGGTSGRGCVISLFAGAHPPEPQSTCRFRHGCARDHRCIDLGSFGTRSGTLWRRASGRRQAAPPLHLFAASRLDRDGKSSEYASLGSSGGSGLAFNNCFPVAGFKSILWPPVLDGPPVVVGLYPHACAGFAGIVPL